MEAHLIECDKQNSLLAGRVLGLERHSREFNLRFLGISESRGEHPVEALQGVLDKVGL